MKLKNIIFVLYSFTLVYCYNVFAFTDSETASSNLSTNDKIIIAILVVLMIILIKGFKKKREIQE